MTENLPNVPNRRSVALETEEVQPLQEEIDRVRLELAELRASGRRLVLAADADRRRLERELHDAVQQHLVALAVKLQLLRSSTGAEPSAAEALFDEIERDMQEALDDTARLAERIHPALLEADGLPAALRAAGQRAGIRIRVDVEAGGTYPPEIAAAVYWCCLEALERAAPDERAVVTVWEEAGALAFEVVKSGERGDTGLDRLRDRVEALGGRLTIGSEPGGRRRVAGSLPLSR